MEVMDLSKLFSVDIFSDHRSNDQKPWVRIGEFNDLEEAIETCKMVVDDFLCSPINAFISPERPVSAFLSYADVPVINGVENLNTFNIYKYLNQRCGEIGKLTRSSSINS